MAEAYLKEQLGNLDVDDSAIVEYCVGLLEDTTMDVEEKQEAIVGYLEAVVEDATDKLAAIVTEAINKLEQDQQQREKDAQAKAQELLRGAQAKEREALQLDATLKDLQTNEPKTQLTAEERRRRELLLRQYDYDQPEIVERADGESELVYRDSSAKPSAGDMLGEGNINSKLVADKERAQRESNRLAHQKKIERDKELLEKQKLKAEKEKRRTMKKEKRRM